MIVSKVLEGLSRVLDTWWYAKIFVIARDDLEDGQHNQIIGESPHTFQTNDFDWVKVIA